MTWPNIIGLGEVMNFPGVVANDPKMSGEIAATVKAGKTVGGHYASPDLGLPFHGYVAGGPADDHEGTRAEDAIARVRQGMSAMLRLGSAWYDVATQIKAVTELGLDPRNFILCTDDSHSGTLVHEGHMDRVVRHAIAQGLKPMTAIQMATINTAQHFGLERELGSITPGRRADLLIVSDLADAARSTRSIARGVRLAKDGKLDIEIPPTPIRRREEHREARQEARGRRFRHRRAGGRERGHGARHRRDREPGADARARGDLAVEDGLVAMDRRNDVCQIALVERHRGTGGVTNALRLRLRLHAATARWRRRVAHDSHHMIVVGTNKDDMALAANRLGEVGGGVVLFSEGQGTGAGRDADRRADVGRARGNRRGQGGEADGGDAQHGLHR